TLGVRDGPATQDHHPPDQAGSPRVSHENPPRFRLACPTAKVAPRLAPPRIISSLIISPAAPNTSHQRPGPGSTPSDRLAASMIAISGGSLRIGRCLQLARGSATMR